MESTKRKRLTDGVTGEWTVIAKVKPGQEKAVLEYFKAFNMELDRSGTRKDVIIAVGTVHDYRTVLFDNGRGLCSCPISTAPGMRTSMTFLPRKSWRSRFDNFLSFCEGYPGGSASHAVKKEWFQAHTHEAVQYTRAYRATVKQIWKALDLQKAFQQVLDDPAAAKALTQIPALRPLLDRAAA